MTTLDLTEPETAAIIRLLRHAIDEDRFPIYERVQTWQAIPDKLEPRPARAAAEAPPPRIYAPPTKGRWRPRRG